MSFLYFKCLAVCSDCNAKTWLGQAARESPRVGALLMSYMACVGLTLFRSGICYVGTHSPSLITCLWSFLLLSVLQILASSPSWIVVLVLGELCSTAWIAVSNMLWRFPRLYTRRPFYWLFLVCCF